MICWKIGFLCVDVFTIIKPKHQNDCVIIYKICVFQQVRTDMFEHSDLPLISDTSKG